MKNHLLILAAVLIISAPLAGPALVVTTNITADTTWTTNDSPVVITCYDFYVETNATLTIEPGVTVRITGTFQVKGQIHASGTANNYIFFEGTNAASTWGHFKFDGTTNYPLRTNLLNYVTVTNLKNYIYISQQTVAFSNCIIRINGDLWSGYAIAAYVNTNAAGRENARLTFVSNDVSANANYDSAALPVDISFISLDGFPSEFRDNTFIFTATGRWDEVHGVYVQRSNTASTWSHWTGNRIVITNSADYVQDAYGFRFTSDMSGLISNNHVRMVIPRGARGIYKYDEWPIVGNTIEIESFGGSFGYIYGIYSQKTGAETNDLLLNNRITITTDRQQRYLTGIYSQAGGQRQNRITTRNDSTNGSQRGIYNVYYGCRIEGNSIIQNSVGTNMCYGIDIEGHANTNAIVSLYNNLVIGPGTNGSIYGIYVADTNTFLARLSNDCNLVWNFATNYVEYVPGPGDLATNPLMADTNFHLSILSPAIDAGTNRDWMTGAVDMDGNPRIVRGRADIGAHEVQQAAMPVIDPGGGVYSVAVTVTLSTATSGATNWYTTNGITPSTNSTLYAAIFTLSNSATVKAIAARPDLLDSAVTSAVFTISDTNHALLTVSSAHDSPVPTNGVHEYALNQGATCTVADTTVTLGTTQYISTGWNLSGHVDTNGASTGTGTQVVMIMTNNAVLTWQWATNYRFAVTSGIGGATAGSTNGWYSAGATIAVTAVPNAHFHFNGWSGDTQGNTNAAGMTALMNRPRTLSANFARDMHALVIASLHGSPVPATGIHTSEYGSILTNAMSGSPEISGGTQYACMGWSMTGNDPASGSSLLFNLTLTNNAALTWLWQTNYLLAIEADPGGVVTGISGGWHAAGTNIVLQAVPDANFTFRGWSGNTTGNTNNISLALHMDRARLVKAHFIAEIIPPPAPINVTASEGTYTDKVVIAWSGNTNATGYEIWRDLIATNAALYAQNTGQYSNVYVIRRPSAAASLRLRFASGVVATIDGSAERRPPENASIWEGETPSSRKRSSQKCTFFKPNDLIPPTTAQKIGTTSDTVFNDTSAIAGFVYSYWIVGTNSAGSSGFSEPASGWRRCVPVALTGDFDGDAKADPAVVQRATGAWRIRLSLQDYAVFDFPALLGEPDEWPLSADFDGDRLTDLVVYRPGTGDWRTRLSGTNYELLELPELLGATNGFPLTADFDGDAKADPAIWQPPGNWLIKLSGTGYAILFLPEFLGNASETALAADFDGDYYGDPATYETASGTWRVKLSGGGYQILELNGFLGGEGFNALAADFDGDAKADPAVFNPSTGDWIILISASGYFRLDLPGFLNDF